MKTKSHLLRSAGGAQFLTALLFLFGLFGYPYVVHAADATLPELMEQAVYSEETKGDLDAAMLLYQQVIAKADTGQALAAQAQFRLASCLDKKMDYAGARAAFEKLIRDYPNQKEVVALAHEYLAESAILLPAPWVDGEELLLNVNLPSGIKIGVARHTVAADTVDGRKIWRISSHLFAGVQQWSRVEVDATSLKPIHCQWKHTLLGESDTIYTPGRATVKMKGKEGAQNIDLTGAVYDNEEALQLMRCLPLAAGYSTKLNILVGLSGGTLLPLQLDVTGPEKVTVPAGTFDCYKVELSIKQTFWYSADAHRYLVKFEASGITGELVSVKTRPSAEAERFADPAHGFSLDLPSGWLAHRKNEPNEAKRTELVLLDPEAISTTMVKVENPQSINEAARASARAFAEHQIERAKKHAKEFTLRADSWTETRIAGNPATSFVADVVVQGNTRQVYYGLCAFVGGKAVEIVSFTAPEDSDDFRPKLDTIVASYQGK